MVVFPLASFLMKATSMMRTMSFVDQLGDGRHDLALEPVARKRDKHVLDRSHAGHAASSPTTTVGGTVRPGRSGRITPGV
jgi:hypothetical protein